MIAAKMATLKRGSNQHSSNDLSSQDDAAKLLNVSVPTLKRAKYVLENGSMASAKMANMNHGGDRKSSEIKPPNGGLMTTEQAAALMNAWLCFGMR